VLTREQVRLVAGVQEISVSAWGDGVKGRCAYFGAGGMLWQCARGFGRRRTGTSGLRTPARRIPRPLLHRIPTKSGPPAVRGGDLRVTPRDLPGAWPELRRTLRMTYGRGGAGDARTAAPRRGRSANITCSPGRLREGAMRRIFGLTSSTVSNLGNLPPKEVVWLLCFSSAVRWCVGEWTLRWLSL
jgi:hypothetical protein